MTTRKPTIPVEATLIPHFTYRVGSPIAQNVIGLSPSQIKAAIERGELPPPMLLTPSGKAKGWTGQQLLDIQRERIARAAAAKKQTAA